MKRHRSVRVLLLLIDRLKSQNILFQVFTIFLIIVLSAALMAFFSSYIIWTIIRYMFINIFLRAIEWYLKLYNNKSPDS